MNPPSSFAVARKPSQSNQSSGGGDALGKLLLLGAFCAVLPDPTACLTGAASAISGTESPDYSSGSSSSSSSTSSSGSSSSSSDRNECRSDRNCDRGEQCVKRGRYSMCVTVVDNRGRKVRDRDAEPGSCSRNSDCPRNFECNRNLKICLKE